MDLITGLLGNGDLLGSADLYQVFRQPIFMEINPRVPIE